MKAIRNKALSILCLMAMIITTVISGIPSVNAAASGASSGTSASVSLTRLILVRAVLLR